MTLSRKSPTRITILVTSFFFVSFLLLSSSSPSTTSRSFFVHSLEETTNNATNCDTNLTLSNQLWNAIHDLYENPPQSWSKTTPLSSWGNGVSCGKNNKNNNNQNVEDICVNLTIGDSSSSTAKPKYNIQNGILDLSQLPTDFPLCSFKVQNIPREVKINVDFLALPSTTLTDLIIDNCHLWTNNKSTQLPPILSNETNPSTNTSKNGSLDSNFLDLRQIPGSLERLTITNSNMTSQVDLTGSSDPFQGTFILDLSNNRLHGVFDATPLPFRPAPNAILLNLTGNPCLIKIFTDGLIASNVIDTQLHYDSSTAELVLLKDDVAPFIYTPFQFYCRRIYTTNDFPDGPQHDYAANIEMIQVYHNDTDNFDYIRMLTPASNLSIPVTKEEESNIVKECTFKLTNRLITHDVGYMVGSPTISYGLADCINPYEVLYIKKKVAVANTLSFVRADIVVVSSNNNNGTKEDKVEVHYLPDREYSLCPEASNNMYFSAQLSATEFSDLNVNGSFGRVTMRGYFSNSSSLSPPNESSSISSNSNNNNSVVPSSSSTTYYSICEYNWPFIHHADTVKENTIFPIYNEKVLLSKISPCLPRFAQSKQNSSEIVPVVLPWRTIYIPNTGAGPIHLRVTDSAGNTADLVQYSVGPVALGNYSHVEHVHGEQMFVLHLQNSHAEFFVLDAVPSPKNNFNPLDSVCKCSVILTYQTVVGNSKTYSKLRFFGDEVWTPFVENCLIKECGLNSTFGSWSPLGSGLFEPDKDKPFGELYFSSTIQDPNTPFQATSDGKWFNKTYSWSVINLFNPQFSNGGGGGGSSSSSSTTTTTTSTPVPSTKPSSQQLTNDAAIDFFEKKVLSLSSPSTSTTSGTPPSIFNEGVQPVLFCATVDFSSSLIIMEVSPITGRATILYLQSTSTYTTLFVCGPHGDKKKKQEKNNNHHQQYSSSSSSTTNEKLENAHDDDNEETSPLFSHYMNPPLWVRVDGNRSTQGDLLFYENRLRDSWFNCMPNASNIELLVPPFTQVQFDGFESPASSSSSSSSSSPPIGRVTFTDSKNTTFSLTSNACGSWASLLSKGASLRECSAKSFLAYPPSSSSSDHNNNHQDKNEASSPTSSSQNPTNNQQQQTSERNTKTKFFNNVIWKSSSEALNSLPGADDDGNTYYSNLNSASSPYSASSLNNQQQQSNNNRNNFFTSGTIEIGKCISFDHFFTKQNASIYNLNKNSIFNTGTDGPNNNNDPNKRRSPHKNYTFVWINVMKCFEDFETCFSRAQSCSAGARELLDLGLCYAKNGVLPSYLPPPDRYVHLYENFTFENFLQEQKMFPPAVVNVKEQCTMLDLADFVQAIVGNSSSPSSSPFSSSSFPSAQTAASLLTSTIQFLNSFPQPIRKAENESLHPQQQQQQIDITPTKVRFECDDATGKARLITCLSDGERNYSLSSASSSNGNYNPHESAIIQELELFSDGRSAAYYAAESEKLTSSFSGQRIWTLTMKGLDFLCTPCISIFGLSNYPISIVGILVGSIFNMLLIFVSNRFLIPKIGPKLIRYRHSIAAFIAGENADGGIFDLGEISAASASSSSASRRRMKKNEDLFSGGGGGDLSARARRGAASSSPGAKSRRGTAAQKKQSLEAQLAKTRRQRALEWELRTTFYRRWTTEEEIEECMRVFCDIIESAAQEQGLVDETYSTSRAAFHEAQARSAQNSQSQFHHHGSSATNLHNNNPHHQNLSESTTKDDDGDILPNQTDIDDDRYYPPGPPSSGNSYNNNNKNTNSIPTDTDKDSRRFYSDIEKEEPAEKDLLTTQKELNNLRIAKATRAAFIAVVRERLMQGFRFPPNKLSKSSKVRFTRLFAACRDQVAQIVNFLEQKRQRQIQLEIARQDDLAYQSSNAGVGGGKYGKNPKSAGRKSTGRGRKVRIAGDDNDDDNDNDDDDDDDVLFDENEIANDVVFSSAYSTAAVEETTTGEDSASPFDDDDDMAPGTDVDENAGQYINLSFTERQQQQQRKKGGTNNNSKHYIPSVNESTQSLETRLLRDQNQNMSRSRFREKSDEDPWASPKDKDSLRMATLHGDGNNNNNNSDRRLWSSPKLTFHTAVEAAVAALERDSAILWVAYDNQAHYLVRSVLMPPSFLMSLQLLLVIAYFIACLIWGVDEFRTSYFQEPGKGRDTSLSLYQLIYFRFLNSSWPTALIVNRLFYIIYSVGSSTVAEAATTAKSSSTEKRRNSSTATSPKELDDADSAATAQVFDISDERNRGKVAAELQYNNHNNSNKTQHQQPLLNGYDDDDDGAIRNNNDDVGAGETPRRRSSNYARGSVHIPQEQSAATADVATKIESKSQQRIKSLNLQLSLKQHVRGVLIELFRDVYFMVPCLLLAPPVISHCIPSIFVFFPVFLLLLMLLVIVICVVRCLPSVPFDPDTHQAILYRGSGLRALLGLLFCRSVTMCLVCLMFKNTFNYSVLWSGLYGGGNAAVNNYYIQDYNWVETVLTEWNAQSLKCLFFTLEGEPINAIQHFGSLFA